MPQLLIDCLEVRRRLARVGSPMISCGAEAVTAEDLHARVRRLAAGLSAAGTQPGDRVLIRLPNGPDFTALWLAAAYLGAVPVMAATSLGLRELTAIIADSEPTAIVTTEVGFSRIAQWLSLGATPVVGLERLEHLAASASPLNQPAATTPDAVASIVYTVAADGTSRGACHSAEAMIASAHAYARGVLELSPADVVGGHPPMSFAYGLGALLVFPLVTGARVVLTDGFDAERLLRTIERERVTVFFGTATCYRLFLRIPGLTTRFNLRSLRACVSAGEPLDAATSADWQRQTGVDLVDGLGTTELFHIVLSQRPGDVTHGSLGTPVPGYEARVVDEEMNDVAHGTAGRLAVRGPTRCRYWNRPDAERDSVREGWNLTGDVVTRDSAGRYWFERRADDLIVSAGYNIAGPEIESVLLTHPAVRCRRRGRGAGRDAWGHPEGVQLSPARREHRRSHWRCKSMCNARWPPTRRRDRLNSSRNSRRLMDTSIARRFDSGLNRCRDGRGAGGGLRAPFPKTRQRNQCAVIRNPQ